MMNLLKLINLHFNIKIDSEIENLLNKDLSLKPEDFAVYIYRLQNEIITLNGENKEDDVLQALAYIQRMYTQVEIYYSAKIGNNFKIIHGLGSVIGSRVVIGDNVTIYQNVTIGDKGTSDGRPMIGDNVVIYAGAKVIGDIEISRDSVIGANAVVKDSFLKASLILGVPGVNKSKILQ